MKRIVLILATVLLGSALQGQEKITKANYALAERFSAKKVNQMVFSTRVQPRWFKDGDRFWYDWQSPKGTTYYIVDPVKGTKTEVFDLERLAMELTEIMKDPFDSQHIPITGLKLKDDKYFTYAVQMKEELVSEPGRTSFFPKVSPDGKWVAYLRDRTEIVIRPTKGGSVKCVLYQDKFLLKPRSVQLLDMCNENM